MQRRENVRSTIKPEPLKMDEYSVYVSTDIKEVIMRDENGAPYIEYEYNQTRYTKDEYIQLMINKNADLETEVSNMQLALCELYEASI